MRRRALFPILGFALIIQAQEKYTGPRPPKPDARRPPIPYRDAEPRAALRVSVAAPWGPVAVTTAHLSFVPWRGRRQLAVAAAFARSGLLLWYSGERIPRD